MSDGNQPQRFEVQAEHEHSAGGSSWGHVRDRNETYEAYLLGIEAYANPDPESKLFHKVIGNFHFDDSAGIRMPWGHPDLFVEKADEPSGWVKIFQGRQSNDLRVGMPQINDRVDLRQAFYVQEVRLQGGEKIRREEPTDRTFVPTFTSSEAYRGPAARQVAPYVSPAEARSTAPRILPPAYEGEAYQSQSLVLVGPLTPDAKPISLARTVASVESQKKREELQSREIEDEQRNIKLQELAKYTNGWHICGDVDDHSSLMDSWPPKRA